jgi:hypothetical protein
VPKLSPASHTDVVERGKANPWVNWHTIRFAAWTAQIPLALATPLKNSVSYLVFLSIAALVESAGTDVVNHVKAAREAGRTRIIEADPDATEERNPDG